MLAGFVNAEAAESVDGVENAEANTTNSIALKLVAVSHPSLSLRTDSESSNFCNRGIPKRKGRVCHLHRIRRK